MLYAKLSTAALQVFPEPTHPWGGSVTLPELRGKGVLNKKLLLGIVIKFHRHM